MASYFKTVLILNSSAARGRAAKMDIGKISFRTHHGEAASRYFHNVASFGLGGEVDQKINRSKKRFGPVSFFKATFSAVAKYGRKRCLSISTCNVRGPFRSVRKSSPARSG